MRSGITGKIASPVTIRQPQVRDLVVDPVCLAAPSDLQLLFTHPLFDACQNQIAESLPVQYARVSRFSPRLLYSSLHYVYPVVVASS